MEENSTEKFRINHLRRRIAEITVSYEDKLSEAAVREQVLTQQVDEWKQHVEALTSEVEHLRQINSGEPVTTEPVEG